MDEDMGVGSQYGCLSGLGPGLFRNCKFDGSLSEGLPNKSSQFLACTR